MESKSTSGVTFTCSNTCTTPVGNTRDDTAYRCSVNLLPFFPKCNTKFEEIGWLLKYFLILVLLIYKTITLHHFHVTESTLKFYYNVNVKMLLLLLSKLLNNWPIWSL